MASAPQVTGITHRGGRAVGAEGLRQVDGEGRTALQATREA